MTLIFWYNWSIHASVVFVFKGKDRYSNVNENGRDSHMVYELDELLFRVYMCTNLFVRTHFWFCFIKANNGFVQLIYIQLLNFDSRLIISSYSLRFLTIENFRFTQKSYIWNWQTTQNDVLQCCNSQTVIWLVTSVCLMFDMIELIARRKCIKVRRDTQCNTY